MRMPGHRRNRRSSSRSKLSLQSSCLKVAWPADAVEFQGDRTAEKRLPNSVCAYVALSHENLPAEITKDPDPKSRSLNFSRIGQKVVPSPKPSKTVSSTSTTLLPGSWTDSEVHWILLQICQKNAKPATRISSKRRLRTKEEDKRSKGSNSKKMLTNWAICHAFGWCCHCSSYR